MIRKLTGSAALLLIFTFIIALGASSAGMAEAKDCANNVTVTDGDDTYIPGQLRTAIGAVCPGGHVKVAPSVSEIWLGFPIVIDKDVSISGTGQTVYGGSVGVFDVSTSGGLVLDGFTLGGGSGYPAITVEGVLVLKNITVTRYSNAITAKPGSYVALKGDTWITDNWNYFREGGCGIYNDGGTVELFDNAAVTDNIGRACFSIPVGWGGGIFGKNGGTIALHDNAVVSGNGLLHCDPYKEGWATRGGGIASFGGTVTLDGNARVSGNWSATAGGILLYTGASLTLNDYAAVTDNHSSGSGGGISVSFESKLAMKDFSTVSGNVAGYNGGGVSNVNSVVTLEDYAQITGNSAGNGGGIYSSDAGFGFAPPELVLKDDAAITGNTPNDVVP